MSEFKCVSKFTDNFIQFLQEKRLEFLVLCKSWNCFKIHFETPLFSEEILNLDNLLVAATLNR